jgi:ADP-ribose pyrophosphatase
MPDQDSPQETPPDDRPRPSRHTFTQTARLLDDFFKIDEYKGHYEQYDGNPSPEQRLLVFERGDSAAALLYDASHREVILIEQFRLPAAMKGQRNGWVLEPAAGMIRPDETPRATIIREIAEETGYQINDLSEIATFFVSPGGTSERIFLYFAAVRRAQKVGVGGGVKRDGENILTIRMPLTEFFAKLRNREFEDAKLIIAGYWLRDRLASMPTADHEETKFVSRRLKLPRGSYVSTRYVGYKSGNIMRIKDVDAWVNPVNTDMMLDRFTDRTVAGTIRRLGAERDRSGRRLKSDTIGEALRRAMGNRTFVRPAKVISTTSGALQRSNNVRCLLHVATTKGEMGADSDLDLSTDLETLERCVDEVLHTADGMRGISSILFPMLGTGEGGLPVNTIAIPLMRRAINYLQANPASRIERVFFLGYSDSDAETLAQAMQYLEDQFEPEPVAAPSRDTTDR